MAYVRLNNDMRDLILKRAIEHRFKKLAEDLNDKHAEFAHKVYRSLFTAKEASLMESLPKGWLREVSGFKVQIAGHYTHLSLNGSSSFLDLTITKNEVTLRRIPDKFANAAATVIDSGTPLADEYSSLANETQALKEKIREAKRSLRAVLNNAKSLGALLKSYPELEPFTKGMKPERLATLPAVPREKLNSLLDLPV